ncbi:MAG: hypothetical protein WD334_10755 [Chitinophagales bacterium]
MRIYDIWEQEGFLKHKGLPVMNYPGPENKWINNFASGSGTMHDSQGNYYYVSHPPLAYYLPYFSLKALGLKVSVFWLQIWHCFIHLFSALLFYLLIREISSARAALLSAVFYMMHGVSLWFQSNVYMSDMLVQLFFISSIYCYVKLQQGFSAFGLFQLGLSIALMVYCSWLGYFTAFVLLLHSFLKKKQPYLIATALISAALVSTALFLYQYAQINGVSALISEWTQRGGERAGFQLQHFISIFKNYFLHYSPLFIVIVALYKSINWKEQKSILFLFFSPIILLHLFLSEYSVHDFTVLYALFPLAYLLALAICNLSSKVGRNALTIMLLLVFIAQYYIFNLPGEKNYKGDKYAYFQEKGKAIAAEKEKGYVLFLLQDKIEPQTSYYAQCNVKSVNSQQEAGEFLEQRNGMKGKIMYFDTNDKLQTKIINN